MVIEIFFQKALLIQLFSWTLETLKTASLLMTLNAVQFERAFIFSPNKLTNRMQQFYKFIT